MSATTLRSDIRTLVRDYLSEATADIFTDAQLNRSIAEELRSLPSKDIYLQELHTTSTVVDQYDYLLPSGTVEIEQVERNDGTSSLPYWVNLNGWEMYAGALYLPYRPSKVDTIRIKIKKEFTIPSGDVVALDLPDDKCEVLVWGVVVRCYKSLIGYLSHSKTWDSVTKPGDLGIATVQSWLRDAKKEYNDLVQKYQEFPKAREIDLVS